MSKSLEKLEEHIKIIHSTIKIKIHNSIGTLRQIRQIFFLNEHSNIDDK